MNTRWRKYIRSTCNTNIQSYYDKYVRHNWSYVKTESLRVKKYIRQQYEVLDTTSPIKNITKN